MGRKKTINQNYDPNSFENLKNLFYKESPKNINGEFSSSNLYYKDWALKKILSRFELTGAPDFWDMEYFYTNLFLRGYISIIDTELGVIPLLCGYSGLNVWQRPTDIVIANPILGSFTRKIGIDGALIKLQYNYSGVGAIINRISTLLSMCDSALSVNLMNSKVPFIAFAEDQSAADTIKKMYDKISTGEPAVVLRKGNIAPSDFDIKNLNPEFYAKDILNAKRTIINEFLTEIGINSTNFEKRERMSLDEVNANNEERLISIQNWIDCVNESLAIANKLYNMNLVFKERTFEDKEVSANEFKESNNMVE